MPSPDLDARLHLLNSNRDAIALMVGKSLAAGLSVEDSVAIVADTRDSVGGALARAMTERSSDLDTAAEAARAHAKEEIPTMVAVVPRQAAVALFASSNPSVSANIAKRIHAGHVRVVVVGAGGSTLLSMAVERLPGGGSA
jgi:hypothetical protein